jgi:uncharacterized HAD superfamily protein
MKIGFDLDGVLYPWHIYFYEAVKRRDRRLQEMSYEDFWKNIKTLEEEYKGLFDRYVNIPKLYNMQKADKHIVKLLDELSPRNTLYYITCRPANSRMFTKAWMQRSKIPQRDNLIFLEGNKAPTIASLGIRFYLEDRLEHYNDIKDITRVLLIKQPWNNYGEGIEPSFDTTLDALVELINILRT